MDARKILNNFLNLSVAEAAGKGLNALFMLYLTNILGSENYGILGTATAYVSFFTLIVILGFDVVGQREISKNSANTSKVVNNITTIKLLLGVIAVGSYLISIQIAGFTGVERIVILIAGLNIIGNGFQINWVYVGLERNGIVALRSFLTGALNIIGVLIFVSDKNHTVEAIAVSVGSILLNSLWMIIYYTKDIGPIKIRFNKEEWKTILKASFYLGLSFLLITIYQNLDILMLRKMLVGSEALSTVGVYNAAHRVMILALVPAAVVQSAFFPQITQIKNIKGNNVVLEKYILFSLIIGIFIAVTVSSQSKIIASVIGNEFGEVSVLLQYLAVTIVIIYLLLVYYVPLIAFGFEKKIALANLLGLALNATANYLLIPDFGAKGAAIATIMGEFGVLLVNIYLFKKLTGRIYFKPILKIILVTGLATVPVYFAVVLDLNPILTFIICLSSFIVAIFSFKLVTLSEIKSLLKR